MNIEEILITTIFITVFLLSLAIIWSLSILTDESQLRRKAKHKNLKENKLINYIKHNPIRIVTIFLYIMMVSVFSKLNYSNAKGIEFEPLIRISSVLLTIFIGYLFAKLFQVRKEKTEEQKIIADYAFKLTGFRRLIYFLTTVDLFWKEKGEVSIARYKHKRVNYRVLEVDIYDEREAKQKFYDDKSFNSLRVLLFYMMEELLIQKYVGWKFDMKESVEYPKPILEWYDHVINQLWYYFDYKYQKHTVGLFDFVELNISYQTQNIKDQLAILDKKYEGIEEITHKTIGEICGEIHKDVLMPMTELTKYNSEYVTRNMRMIFYLMILVLITGLLIPMISQYLDTQIMVANILGFISIASIGISIIWLVFSLKEMIYEELNTA